MVYKYCIITAVTKDSPSKFSYVLGCYTQLDVIISNSPSCCSFLYSSFVSISIPILSAMRKTMAKVPTADPDKVARVAYMMTTGISNYIYGSYIVSDGGAHLAWNRFICKIMSCSDISSKSYRNLDRIHLVHLVS